MNDFNLFELVTDRRLGPLHCGLTRLEVERLLGPPSRAKYPDVAEYGHIGFDFGPNSMAACCAIQILYPHETLRIDNPTIDFPWWDTWPDPRFNWELWRLVPGADLESVAKSLPDFDECEWIQPQTRLRGLSSDHSRVEILFEQEYDSDTHTIKLISVFPMS